MVGGFHQLRSLKTRVTLLTLAIFLVSIWMLAYYTGRTLRDDMEQVLGAQQFSTATFIASDINDKVEDAFQLLASTAQAAAPLMERGAPDLHKLLDERPVLKGKFNGGILILRADGTAIAEYPAGGGRVGDNYIDIDTVAAAIEEGGPLSGGRWRAKYSRLRSSA